MLRRSIVRFMEARKQPLCGGFSKSHHSTQRKKKNPAGRATCRFFFSCSTFSLFSLSSPPFFSLSLSLSFRRPAPNKKQQQPNHTKSTSSDHKPRPLTLLEAARRLPPRHLRGPRRGRPRPEPRWETGPGVVAQVPRLRASVDEVAGLRPRPVRQLDHQDLMAVLQHRRREDSRRRDGPHLQRHLQEGARGDPAVDRHRAAEPRAAPSGRRGHQGVPHQGRLVRVRGADPVGVRPARARGRQAQVRPARDPRSARGRRRPGQGRRPHLAAAAGRGAAVPRRGGGVAAGVAALRPVPEARQQGRHHEAARGESRRRRCRCQGTNE